MSRKNRYTPAQAAKYFGCSVRYIRRMRRLGWLRAIEDEGKVRPCEKFEKTHYSARALHDLAWHYLLQLSPYDVANLRNHPAPETVQPYRGVPKLVVDLARSDECAGIIAEIAQRGNHQGRRATLAAEIRRRGFDPFAIGRRRDAETKPEDRKWENIAGPIKLTTLHRREIRKMLDVF